MIIFLFVSILLHSDLRQKIDKSDKVKKDICQSLDKRFQENKERWGIKICKNGVNIRFESEVHDISYFSLGKSDLHEKFRIILRDFIPALLEFMIDHRKSIDELRIEGYADSHGFSNSIIEYCSNRFLFLSEWRKNHDEQKFNEDLLKKLGKIYYNFAKMKLGVTKLTPNERLYLSSPTIPSEEIDCLVRSELGVRKTLSKGKSQQLNYLKNTHLSLERSRSVLRYLMRTPSPPAPPYDEWKDLRITAHGFSSSKLAESDAKSRRVEFRILAIEEKQVAEATQRLGKTRDE